MDERFAKTVLVQKKMEKHSTNKINTAGSSN